MAGIVQVAVARLLRLPSGIPRLLPRFFGKRVFPAAVVGDKTVVRRSAQTGDGSRQPGGVNDAQVVPLQHERLCGEKAVQRRFAGGGVMLPRGEICGILVSTLREIPAGARLGSAQQQVDFMIAEHHLRVPGGVGPHEPVQHGGNVVAAINEVADEDEAPPLRMTAVRAVAEMAEQLLQGGVFAVDVADDVEGTGRQHVNMGHGVDNVVANRDGTRRRAEDGTDSTTRLGRANTAPDFPCPTPPEAGKAFYAGFRFEHAPSGVNTGSAKQHQYWSRQAASILVPLSGVNTGLTKRCKYWPHQAV